MPESTKKTEPIVTHELQSAAHEVIYATRRTIRHPFLLDAKLGDGGTAPMTDAQIAATHDTPRTTIKDKMERVVGALIKTDQEYGSPLEQIAQRANDVMAAACITNLHKRRPPLYSESTITTFFRLDFATPEHSSHHQSSRLRLTASGRSPQT